MCSDDENPGDLLHVLGELSLTGEGGNDDEDGDDFLIPPSNPANILILIKTIQSLSII